MGRRTSIRNMVSARGCSIKTITFLEGHQAELSSVGALLVGMILMCCWTKSSSSLQCSRSPCCFSVALQIESDVERNTAVYGDVDVAAVLEGTMRPPDAFRGLIDALIKLEE